MTRSRFGLLGSESYLPFKGSVAFPAFSYINICYRFIQGKPVICQVPGTCAKCTCQAWRYATPRAGEEAKMVAISESMFLFALRIRASMMNVIINRARRLWDRTCWWIATGSCTSSTRLWLRRILTLRIWKASCCVSFLSFFLDFVWRECLLDRL